MCTGWVVLLSEPIKAQNAVKGPKAYPDHRQKTCNFTQFELSLGTLFAKKTFRGFHDSFRRMHRRNSLNLACMCITITFRADDILIMVNAKL